MNKIAILCTALLCATLGLWIYKSYAAPIEVGELFNITPQLAIDKLQGKKVITPQGEGQSGYFNQNLAGDALLVVVKKTTNSYLLYQGVIFGKTNVKVEKIATLDAVVDNKTGNFIVNMHSTKKLASGEETVLFITNGNSKVVGVISDFTNVSIREAQGKTLTGVLGFSVYSDSDPNNPFKNK